MTKKKVNEPSATIKISDVKEAFDIVKNECERLAGELGMKPSAADVIRFAVISTAKQYSGGSGTSTCIKLSREEYEGDTGE